MYLRESRRRNKDGTVVSYLQLAHNERHPRTGSPVAKVIHNFGRADLVDREALRRLVASISRFLEPEQAVAAAAAGQVEVLEARRMGGSWVLGRLWERLEIGQAICRVASGRRLDGQAAERVIFALVAQRALEPASKLAATRWVAERVFIEDCPGFSDDAAYRAMDFLLGALEEIAAEVFASVAHLLNLDVDALARQGRYRAVAGNLRVKEVWVPSRDAGERAERFVVCHNPEQAERDRLVRGRLVTHLEGLIGGSDAWTQRKRDELAGSLKDKPGLRRFLRRTPRGLLRIDKAAIKREASLDGKWLLRTNDETLTPDDLAAACKQLIAVERGWRDMKGALKLRPVCHYREDRIRAWSPLLLTETTVQ